MNDIPAIVAANSAVSERHRAALLVISFLGLFTVGHWARPNVGLLIASLIDWAFLKGSSREGNPHIRAECPIRTDPDVR
ncbi:MAG: hypothetical protein KKC85_10995 [Gammaproteobacteria bacterium]|nr:hypothetical protein [Gammaproteobacteria bacterium]MBU2286949.1 hypothetical protein [Gammaproteobacteria bacterium]